MPVVNGSTEAEFHEAAGSKEKFEQINKLIDMLDEKVQIGSLSQDEENKASDIDKLIADIDGGDLVAALANPSKEQMETLRKHKDKLSWRMKAVLCNFDENKDIAFWFGWSHYAIFGYVRTFLLDVFDMVYDKARVVMTWNKMSKEEQKGIKAVVKVAKEMNDMIEKALRDHDKAIRRETKQSRKRQKKSKTNNTKDDDTILNLMRTGQFDDTINKYMEERANGAPPRGNVSFEAVTSKGEMKKLREMEKNNRRRAEKTRTTEDIDNDPNIGAFVEETNDFD